MVPSNHVTTRGLHICYVFEGWRSWFLFLTSSSEIFSQVTSSKHLLHFKAGCLSVDTKEESGLSQKHWLVVSHLSWSCTVLHMLVHTYDKQKTLCSHLHINVYISIVMWLSQQFNRGLGNMGWKSYGSIFRLYLNAQCTVYYDILTMLELGDRIKNYQFFWQNSLSGRLLVLKKNYSRS